MLRIKPKENLKKTAEFLGCMDELTKIGFWDRDELPDVDLDTINELFLLTQPAHLQKILRREMDPEQRGYARADYIRGRLGAN